MLSPIICGTFFGTRALAGLLAGALVSGVQMAVSMSNTGGAWDNAKKYIEVSGLLYCSGEVLVGGALLWASFVHARVHLQNRQHRRTNKHVLLLLPWAAVMMHQAGASEHASALLL
jgi:cytochrome bd-type quinol oxidase subunit 2